MNSRLWHYECLPGGTVSAEIHQAQIQAGFLLATPTPSLSLHLYWVWPSDKAIGYAGSVNIGCSFLSFWNSLYSFFSTQFYLVFTWRAKWLHIEKKKETSHAKLEMSCVHAWCIFTVTCTLSWAGYSLLCTECGLLNCCVNKKCGLCNWD